MFGNELEVPVAGILNLPELIESKMSGTALSYYESRTSIRNIPGTVFSYALF